MKELLTTGDLANMLGINTKKIDNGGFNLQVQHPQS